jgi:TonB family protein
MNSRSPSPYFSGSLLISALGHVALVAVIVIGRFWEGDWVRDIPAYSVTIETGRSLGGRAQVAKQKDPVKVSPSKAAVGKDAPTPAPKKASTPAQQPIEPQKAEPQEIAPQPTAAPEPPQPEPTTAPEVPPTAAPQPPLPEPTVAPEAPKPVPVSEPVSAPTAVPVVAPTEAAPTPRPRPNAASTAAPAKPAKAPVKPKNVEKDYQSAMQRYLGDSSQAGGNGFGAARLGGQGFGGGEQKSPEFFEYLETIKRAVHREWRWFDSRSILIVEIELQIATDGTILDQRIMRSSGNDEYDDSVYRAIIAASPLPPPPTSVYRDFKVVRIIFDARDK